MNKFFLLFAGGAFVSVMTISCENTSLQDQMESEVSLETRDAHRGKVDVCHFDKELEEYQHINISKNAVEKHIENHGDMVVDLAEADADGDGIADCADCFPDDPELGQKNTWYEDADGDGYGDPESAIKTCMTLEEANAFFASKEDENDQKVFVDNNTDCDDTNPEIHEGCE